MTTIRGRRGDAAFDTRSGSRVDEVADAEPGYVGVGEARVQEPKTHRRAPHTRDKTPTFGTFVQIEQTVQALEL